MWTTAVLGHLELLADAGHLAGRTVRAIYWGGGTPSLATNAQITVILTRLRELVNFEDEAEISIEARPRPELADYLLGLCSTAGITRCSLGIQTFDHMLLRRWGGHADVSDVAQQVRRLPDQLVVSLDLLYNGPGQTVQQFEDDLRRALDLGVDQVSAYEMVLTPQERLWRRRALSEGDGSCALRMFELALDVLTQAGLVQVVFSDFARPGRHSIYELEHWRSPQVEVLGLGPGAISYFGGYQFANLAQLDAYSQSIRHHRIPTLAGSPVSEEEELCRNLALGVKALQIDAEGLKRSFPGEFARYEDRLIRCTEQGWLAREGSRYQLTKSGMWYIDNLSKDFYSTAMRGHRTPDETDLLKWTRDWVAGGTDTLAPGDLR